jgi:hypothetical protein
MGDKATLQGSFGSLLDTLNNRFDPLQPEDIVAQWTSTMARCAACARNVAAWDALASASPAYDPIIAALDGATRGLVTADYGNSAEVKNALQATSDALDQLEGILGT